MVKYYCDMCKLEKTKSDIRVLQTKQPDGSVQTNHLCGTCCIVINELCKNYLSAPGQVGETPDEKKIEKAVKPKKNPTLQDIIDIDKQLTGEDKHNFAVKMDSFREDMPKPPKTGSIQNMQRALLCIYKGMQLGAIQRDLGFSYQNIYQWKTKYASKLVAQRHMEKKRMEATTVCIIDGFIQGVDVETLGTRHGKTVEEVKEILEFYTGLYW